MDEFTVQDNKIVFVSVRQVYQSDYNGVITFVDWTRINILKIALGNQEQIHKDINITLVQKHFHFLQAFFITLL